MSRFGSFIVALALGCQGSIDDSELVVPADCSRSGRKACEAACARDDGAACLAASIAHRKRRNKMMEYEQRACELGEAQGCLFYANNFKGGDDADPAQARHYSELACKLGSGDGCVWLAKQALRPDAEGSERMGDPKAAREYWSAACEAEPTRCGGLADFEALGLGGPQDEDAARAHYKVACDTGKGGPSCINLEADADPSRVWLAIDNWAMFEVVARPKINLELQGAMPGEEFLSYVGVCYQGGSYSPVFSGPVRDSENAAVDQAVAASLARWRMRPRKPFPDDKAGCIAIEFKLKQDPHITTKFGS